MAPTTYTLYHNLFSICSIMVRQTIAICGQAKDAGSEIAVTEQVVDIFNQEQLSEHFLCEINRLGQVRMTFLILIMIVDSLLVQVPVLVSDALENPITDSLQITHFLAARYPSLIPASHRAQITELLRDLHAINYFSLSFPGREYVVEGFKQNVSKLLAADISPRYRDALIFKLGV